MAVTCKTHDPISLPVAIHVITCFDLENVICLFNNIVCKIYCSDPIKIFVEFILIYRLFF